MIEPNIAVECEGGTWTRGRHVRPIGFLQDCEKYNTATAMGILVLRVTNEHIRSGAAIDWVKETMRISSCSFLVNSGNW